MKNKTSPLRSLDDPLYVESTTIGEFRDLGSAPFSERHIAVFFQQVKSSHIYVNKSRIELNINCSGYTLKNHSMSNTGSVYGLLFCVNRKAYDLNKNRLFIRGGGELCDDFAVLPVLNEKLGLYIYADSNYNIIANTGQSKSKFVVLDE